MNQHPIRLVAPWFRWQRQRNNDNVVPRRSRPVFLKYDSPKLVNMFLANPQRNYEFNEDDRVGVLEPSPYSGKIRRFTDVELRSTSMCKLFRDTHQRSYLVALELHCDVPGLPDAGWDHICELGFVVRRWVRNDPGAGQGLAQGLDKQIALLKAHLIRLRSGQDKNLLESTHPRDTKAELLDVIADGPDAIRARRALYEAELAQLRESRAQLERPNPTEWHLQYWKPDLEHEGIGSWEPAGSPKQLFEGEKVYRLYRLMPDPRLKDHRSLGARLLFGVVPTSDMDTTEQGEPHFDADDTYEIRGFVRQHKPGRAIRLNEADCCGALVWSEATEPYRIAPHFDPVGTSQLVVNVEMPDLSKLAAKPFDMLSMRMKWPALSKPTVSAFGFPPGLGLAGGMVCCKSIPLITIVATILLEIFTPIIVALLQLYYLMYSNFCFGMLPAPSLPLQMLDALAPQVLPNPKTSDALLDEFKEPELQPIALAIAASATVNRTRKLTWEDEYDARPRVDDPLLVLVTA